MAAVSHQTQDGNREILRSGGCAEGEAPDMLDICIQDIWTDICSSAVAQLWITGSGCGSYRPGCAVQCLTTPNDVVDHAHLCRPG